MSSTSLNVIALISGGKDSLFSLLHCIQNGHRIVALANLYPASTTSSQTGNETANLEGEDINSFMYQTVGHSIVPLYAEALNLPLYRRQISGQAVNTGKYYAFTEQDTSDETEDLFPLLQEIMQNQAEANAVVSGAILSTYQRTRIESVAVRLGLTPVAYLWQYPALPPPIEREDSLTGLLDDMEAAGCDARLIKIASAGIEGSLLWSRVSDPAVQRRIATGMSRFIVEDELSLRGAILGEGGEYETLAVDGPPVLWKKRIEIGSRSNVTILDEDGTLRLAFGKSTLVKKVNELADDELPLVRVPAMLDSQFSLMEKRLQAGSSAKGHLECSESHAWSCQILSQDIFRASRSFTINNVIDPKLSKNVTEQMSAIIDQLEDLLRPDVKSTVDSSRVIATTILLRHISDFAAINAIYGKQFNHTNPPARVTICCGDRLPPDVFVSISFTLTWIDPAMFDCLHIQSISYWAPANIGPYSQALNVPVWPDEGCKEEVVHLAGQIPLLPSSMQLLEGDFLDQAILSLQHLWRVGQCAGVDWFTHGIAYLADAEIAEIQRRAKMAWEVWKAANAPTPIANEDQDPDDTADLDAWDLKHNHQIHHLLRPSTRSPNSHLHKLPNHNVLTRDPTPPIPITPPIPPFLAAHVSSLPRCAPIEWHSLGLAHLPKHPSSNPRLNVSTENTEDSLISTCKLEPEPSDNSDATSTSSSTSSGKDKKEETPTQTPNIQSPPLTFFSIQIFTLDESTPSRSLDERLQIALSSLRRHDTTREEDQPSFSHTAIYVCDQAGCDAVTAVGIAGMGMLIPCWSLWGEGGRRVEIGVVGLWEG